MADRLLSDSPVYKLQGSRAGGVPYGSTLACINGDSKAEELADSLRWAASLRCLDVDAWTGRTGNAGGYGIGGSPTNSAGGGAPGLTNPARMATELAAYKQLVALGYTVDEWLGTATNDGAALTPEQTLANYRKHHNEVVRAAGLRRMVIRGLDPKSTTASDNRQLYALNRLLQQYVAENPADTAYVDSTNYLLDPSVDNVNGFPTPYTYFGTGTAPPAPVGSFMRDYVHKSNYGCFAAGKAVGALAAKLYPRRGLPVLSQVGEYSSGTLRGNLGGAARRTVKVGGGTNAYDWAGGTGSITGTPPPGIVLQGEGGGTFSMAWAAENITVSTDDDVLPRGVYPTAALSFSGSTGARASYGATAIIGEFPVTYDPAIPAGTLLSAGALIYLNAVVGLMGVRVNVPGVGIFGVGVTAASASPSPLAEVIAEPITGFMHLEAIVGAAPSSMANGKVELVFYFAPNRSVGGKANLIVPGYAHIATPLSAIPAAA